MRRAGWRGVACADEARPRSQGRPDQGRRWINVTPRTDLVGAKLSLEPVGARQAFLVAVHPGKSAIVYVTTDGGKTWVHGNRVPVLYGDGGAYLARRGKDVWLEVGGGGAPNAAAQLFTSRDGGITRRLVSKHGPSGSGTLPGFGWLVFTSAQDGFTSTGLGKGTDLAGLYRTDDGGTTWTPVPLIGQWLEIDPPHLAREDGLAQAYLPDPLYNLAEFLRTTDGGQKWSVVVSNLTQQSPMAGNVDVLNAETALVADVAGDIHRTTNGGLSWQTISPGASSKGLMRQNVIGYLSFSSPRVGWAVMMARSHPLGAQTLYLTTDGGRSRTEVAK